MNVLFLSGLLKIQSVVTLSATLVLMGCASGMTKTEQLQPWKFDEGTIEKVKANCKTSFKPATAGTIEGLWANKRLILRQSRDCSEAANILAEQAENRNKVIGN
jgi:hypothetical protein